MERAKLEIGNVLDCSSITHLHLQNKFAQGSELRLGKEHLNHVGWEQIEGGKSQHRKPHSKSERRTRKKTHIEPRITKDNKNSFTLGYMLLIKNVTAVGLLAFSCCVLLTYIDVWVEKLRSGVAG